MTSGFPPSLPTTTNRPERLHREGTTESRRIIYTSYTVKRERGRELVRDRPPAVRKRATKGADGDGKGKGAARRDPTSNAALRVHGNECSSYANGASRRSRPLHEETAFNENREEPLASREIPARELLGKGDENGFVR